MTQFCEAKALEKKMNKETHLQLFNSLTRQKEIFAPMDEKNVTMYCCGPTVYSYAHIGNARAAVVADVLFRVLRYIYGEDHVKYARNITDIDDKIIKASNTLGVPMEELTEKYARIYNEDLAAIGCLPPTYQPKATDNIAQMANLIVKLLDAGLAYISDGHVLFDVTKDADYGKLSGRGVDDNLAGARVEVARYKKNASDFVLWKPAKADEPSWHPSDKFPPGRPGWHLECSAMIKETLGETIDIHLGGIDLKFPHHENEIAQSECANHAPLANYWVHNAFLNMGKDKMSKSLGNVQLIHDLLKDWDGEVIRLALLKAHYRSELVWTEDLLKESKAQLDGWYRQVKAQEEPDITELLDDLNTPEALRTHGGAKCLGLLQKDPDEWFRGKAKDGGLSDKEIEALIAERDEVRKAKNWVRADEIRDLFARENIILEDGKDGTSWRRG